MTDTLNCWNCGAALTDLPMPISRHAQCQRCFEVLHCCRMCRWYAPGRPQDCDHDRAEPPVEKTAANFCEFFAPTRNAFNAKEASGKDLAKSRAAALFGETDSDDEDGEANSSAADGNDPKSRLDDLFRD